MALRSFQLFVASLALILLSGTQAATPVAHSRTAQSETTSLKVTCKVFVTETGIPSNVEVLKIEPSVALSEQEKQTKEVTRVLLTWTFTPNKENGKPVAGYVVVPVIIDLAFPLPVSGT